MSHTNRKKMKKPVKNSVPKKRTAPWIWVLAVLVAALILVTVGIIALVRKNTPKAFNLTDGEIVYTTPDTDFTFDNADTLTDWKAVNTAVATVYNGWVTPHAVGKTEITAKNKNGKTLTCTVTVLPLAVKENENGTLRIASYLPLSEGETETDLYENVRIPARIAGKTVESVASFAFNGNATVKTVTVEGGVALGAAAFANCKALTEFSAGTGLCSLPTSAFSGCTALETVHLPRTLTEIGEGCFKGCSALQTVGFDGSAKQWAKVSLPADFPAETKIAYPN